ncbi:MAG: hypothetical protein ACXVRS_08970 [Gaiellaceae bacterium]
MAAISTTRPNRLTADAGRVRRLPVAPTHEQRILAVEFRSPDGRHWKAIGGGATVAAAITDAHLNCPDGATWVAVSWNDLYGE